MTTYDTFASIAGHTFIVTGGNTGIGAEICRFVGRNEGNVVIDWVDREENNQPLIDEITAAGGRAVAVRADVTKVDELQSLVDAAVEHFGRLDVMVNNAGLETRKSLLDSDERDFDLTMNVNLKGAYFGTQLAARQFIKQAQAGGVPGGLVVNMSSVHEDWPMPGNHAYCVSKGGMRMLTRNAAVELAPHRIRVVGIAPGAVATPMNTESLGWEEAERALKKEIPLERVATPGEIAALVMFLASSGGTYITATTLTVDGGITQESSGL
ncbi:SDR family NAD(P)-dependent oxidoreductase [Propionibacteriaceae bacterium G1746]|uniref:SDR family NAD(P)-dependent oxidoreductase n=1 Tax=Aestuariimicrobium sp. G57 TaxID=3418485 RepID=UPI003C15E010